MARASTTSNSRAPPACRSTPPTSRATITPCTGGIPTPTAPTGTGPRSSASGVLTMMEHTGTHIDALSHQADRLHLCGGVPAAEAETPGGFLHHGVETVPPLVRRGVLLDVAGHKGLPRLPPCHGVSAKELVDCAAGQGVQVIHGDVLLVRTATPTCGVTRRRPSTRPACPSRGRCGPPKPRRGRRRGRQHGLGRLGSATRRRARPCSPTCTCWAQKGDLHHREPDAGRAGRGPEVGVRLRRAAAEAGQRDRPAAAAGRAGDVLGGPSGPARPCAQASLASGYPAGSHLRRKSQT
ncbi:MAG: cyclase family protein [Gemmataceae bacterium]